MSTTNTNVQSTAAACTAEQLERMGWMSMVQHLWQAADYSAQRGAHSAAAMPDSSLFDLGSTPAGDREQVHEGPHLLKAYRQRDGLLRCVCTLNKE